MAKKTNAEIIQELKESLAIYQESVEQLTKQNADLIRTKEEAFKSSPSYSQMQNRISYLESLNKLTEQKLASAESKIRRMDDAARQVYADNQKLISENTEAEYFIGITENYHEAEEWQELRHENMRLQGKIHQLQESISLRDAEILRLQEKFSIYIHSRASGQAAPHNERGAGRKKMDASMQKRIQEFNTLIRKKYSKEEIMNAMKISQTTYYRYHKLAQSLAEHEDKNSSL